MNELPRFRRLTEDETQLNFALNHITETCIRNGKIGRIPCVIDAFLAEDYGQVESEQELPEDDQSTDEVRIALLRFRIKNVLLILASDPGIGVELLTRNLLEALREDDKQKTTIAV